MCCSCNAQGSHELAEQDAERNVTCLQRDAAVFYGRKVWRSPYFWFVDSTSRKRENASRGPTPEWVGWTVTGPSPAEGHLPWPGVLVVGELTQVPHYPER